MPRTRDLSPQKEDISQKRNTLTLGDCRILMEKELYREAKAGLVNLLHTYKSADIEVKLLQSTLILYADAQRQTGHFEESYNNYCVLVEGDPELEALLLRPIYHCLSYIEKPRLDSRFEKYLVSFITAHDTDTVLISGLVTRKLRLDLHIDDENYEIELQDISKNVLLLAALPLLVLSDPGLELFLNQLRFYLLSVLLDHGNVDFPLTVAMALRAHNNEYINYVTPIEAELISGLFSAIEAYCQASGKLDEIEAELVVLAMYMPLEDFPSAVGDIKDWPDACAELVLVMIDKPREEKEIESALISIAPISNDVSRFVQEQYESHPYPLWKTTHIRPLPLGYLEAFPHLKPLLARRDSLEANLSCLVAGGGTGKHPITLAKNIVMADIVVLDLSRASLAYASCLAKKYDVQNIEFVHGDILDVGKMGREFDVIECVGVLHHMEDPHKGLSSLLKVLAPGGVLNLGLYSELARREIRQIRDANLKVDMALTMDNIREFRFELLSQGSSALLKSEDFYATSSCHDLLFHQQECQFTIPELTELLEHKNLEFLGFHSLNERCFDRYRKAFPEDQFLTNLKNWHLFESEYPDTFAQMYQFHCRMRV